MPGPRIHLHAMPSAGGSRRDTNIMKLTRASALLLPLLTFHLMETSAHGREATARREIDYLLKAIEDSKARFQRNGREYAASEGVAHLRQKLEVGGERIQTADDFVTGAATKSSLSGKPYLIVFPGQEPRSLQDWLREKLAAYRTSRRAAEH